MLHFIKKENENKNKENENKNKENENSFFSKFIKSNKNKQKNENLFANFRQYDLNKTPVFLTFIFLIFTINFAIFILASSIKWNDQFGSKFLDGIIGFGANNRYFVFEKFQFWRLIVYPFIEPFKFSTFLNIFLSIFSFWFIMRTFWIVGYYLNVFIGSKKTLIIWIVSIILIGLLQVSLTKYTRVFYYGTEYLTLISLGALLGIFITASEKENQVKNEIKKIFLLVCILLVIFLVIKYKNLTEYEGLYPKSSFIEFGTYIFIFYYVSFLSGFILFLLLSRKKIKDITTTYVSILVLISIFTVIVVFTTIFIVQEKIVWQEETTKFFEKFPNLYLLSNNER